MTRRTWILPLAIAIVSLSGSARAQRKVLLTDPAIADDVPLTLTGDVSDSVYKAIQQAGAQPLSAADVQDKMQELGVGSLSSREDTLKVARAVGADMVLGYQAKMKAELVYVSVSVFFVGAGRASMVEREIPPADAAKVAGTMVAELIPPQTPAAPGATPLPGPGEPPPPASQPAEAPTSQPASPPDPERWAAGPRAARGVALGFHLGGSIPVGSGANDEFIETGLRIGMHAGYQIRLGERHALVPELALQQSSWGFKSGTSVGAYPITGDVSVLHLMPGVRYLLLMGPVEIFAAAHVGLAHATQTIVNANDNTDKYDSSETAFGFDVGTGAHFMFLKWLGGGLFVDVSKSFIDPIVDSALGLSSEYDALAVGIGLSVKGKIPF